jgi:muramoyltetrapeptide carboxypeptidase LdcA involved in peptidoglycan recycling
VKEAIIIVDKNGKITIRFQGYYGDTCFQEAEKIYQQLKQLGVDVKVEQTLKTPEAYIRQTTRSRVVEADD